MAIVETNLSPDINSRELFDARYEVYRQDRCEGGDTKKSGGGLILAIKKHIPVIPLVNWNECCRAFESLWLKCKFFGKDVFIGLCYLPPTVKKATVKHFVELLSKKTELMQNRLLLLGDFNIPEFGQEMRNGCVHEIECMMNTFDLQSFNLVKNSKNRTLDLCLSNIERYEIGKNKKAGIEVEKTTSIVKTVDSHHPPLLITMSLKSEVVKVDQSLEFNPTIEYMFKKSDPKKIEEQLQSSRWDVMQEMETCDHMTDYFYKKIKDILSTSMPEQSKKFSQNKKQKFPLWWHKETKKMFFFFFEKRGYEN